MEKEILKYAAEYISDKDVPLEKRAELKLAFIHGCEKILSLNKDKVTDEDIHNYVERVYLHHSDSVIWAFKDGAKWMRGELQHNSFISDKELIKKAIDDCIVENKMPFNSKEQIMSAVNGYILGYKRNLIDKQLQTKESDVLLMDENEILKDIPNECVVSPEIKAEQLFPSRYEFIKKQQVKVGSEKTESLQKAFIDGFRYCEFNRRNLLISQIKLQSEISELKKQLDKSKLPASEKNDKPYLKVFLDWFLKWQRIQSVNPSFEKILESFKNSDEYKEFAIQ